MIEDYETFVRVSRDSRGRRRYRITFEFRGVRAPPRVTGTFELPPWRAGEPAPSARMLAEAVFATTGEQVAERLPPGQFLVVDLRADELYRLPWEELLDFWPLDVGWPSRRVVRYTRQLARSALVPLAMPFSVLVAGVSRREDDALDVLDAFYRVVTASRADAANLHGLSGAVQFDVVHLRCRARHDEAGEPVLFLREDVERAGSSLAEQHVRALVRRAGARLLVLETDAESRPAALDLAHRVGRRVRVAAVVGNADRDSFGAFYRELAHDMDLPFVLTAASFERAAALHIPREGESLLSLSRAAAAMATSIDAELARVRAARADVEKVAVRGRGLEPPREESLVRLDADLRELTERTYEYSRESRGLGPMMEASEAFATICEAVEAVVPQTRRVVNTWFEAAARPLPPSSSLKAGASYALKVSIGPRTERSNVAEPVPVSEEALASAYDEGYVDLRVVLFSRDFGIAMPEATMRLPEPPNASKPVEFAVSTPRRPGTARLRICIYYRNNLLQALSQEVGVTHAEIDPHPVGNRGTVEWALTGSFRDLERFEERTLNILANEAADGTHLFGIVGSDFEKELRLPPDELKTKIGNARDELQKVCSTLKGDGTPDRYRFRNGQRGTPKQLLGDLRELALLGYSLWVDLVTRQDADFEERLRDLLERPATIQISRLRSAKYVFPWSLVYDQPFIHHDDNVLCPDFAGALAGGATAASLEQTTCLSSVCRHRDDANVVCPSGFWGFHHVIEQPLSLERDDRSGTPDLDLPSDIEVDGQLNALVGLSEQLAGYDDHTTDVRGALVDADVDAQSELLAIGDGLRRADLHLVYFYCHGGRRSGIAWLGIGRKKKPERLFPDNLKTWGIKWPRVHPLVFINGCRTVGVSPDDMLDFNHMLAWCNASGVIGTEITIPEELAQYVGKRFLTAFRAKEAVGATMRALRLELLARYNPLGLVYTPYCMAGLHISGV